LVKFLYQILVKGNGSLVKEIVDNCEDVVTGNSIEELVEKMNAIAENHVQLEAVKNAIKEHDEDVVRGPGNFKDQQLQWKAKHLEFRSDKLRIAKFQKIFDQKSMPLIAIREFILSRKSLGGIQTDLDTKVLKLPNKDGKQEAFDNLYCIGEAAGFGGGGMHGRRSLEGTFLGGCVITARVAANAILGRKIN
ncbi:MAG: FAD-binding protein, partial [Bacteroidota bacterium]